MTKSKSPASSYIKYSGIAFQLAGLIFIAYFIGSKLDKKFGLEPPYITLALIIFVFVTYMYKLYIELFPNERK
jgi:hypothetical protein